jgi:hypothetical protein
MAKMERCTQENKKHLSWKQIILIISILQEIRGVPGVPSLVSRRKMTLKLNYIYMKVL